MVRYRNKTTGGAVAGNLSFRGAPVKTKNMKCFIALLAVCVALCAFGCKKKVSGDLQFWGGWTGPDRAQMEKIVADFNKQGGGMKVVLTTFQWDAMFNKFIMSVKSGDQPDVIAMHQTDIPQYASLGVIEPMDDSLAKMNMKESDFDANAWNGFKYKDKMYAMPLDIHSFAMYYNLDLFKEAGITEPPTDRASLLAAAGKLTKVDASGKITQYGIGIPATHQHGYRLWYSLLIQGGGAFLGSDGKAAFNSPAGIAAYQFLHDLIYLNKVAPQNEEDVLKGFQAGKVAIIFDGPWQIPGLDEMKDLHYGVAPFPRIFEKRAVWANSHGLCLPAMKSADPKRRAAALKLLRFISENSLDWAKGGQIPVRKSVVASPEFKKLIRLKPFLDSAPDAVYLPKFEKGSEIFASNAGTPMMAAMQAVLLDKMTPKQALDEAAKQVDEILARK
jgi:multiple sugar transport system substrate-binding protein